MSTFSLCIVISLSVFLTIACSCLQLMSSIIRSIIVSVMLNISKEPSTYIDNPYIIFKYSHKYLHSDFYHQKITA